MVSPLKNLFGGKKSREEEMMSGSSASGADKEQSSPKLQWGKKPPEDACTFAERIAAHPSLYEEFEGAFLANVEVQTYLDYPLYEVYSSAFSKLCEPLLKFVGFSHYGESLDEVWQDGLKKAVKELKSVLNQERPQADGERKKREWEQKLKLKLSQKCIQLLLDFIPYSYSFLKSLASYDNLDREKKDRLQELMSPDSNKKADGFKAWKKALKLQVPGFSGKEMEEMYQRLSDVIQKFIKVEISSEQRKKLCSAYKDFGASVEQYLKVHGESIGMKLHFYEDAEVQESKMKLHFHDSPLKHPGLFKVSGKCVFEGGYPSSEQE